MNVLRHVLRRNALYGVAVMLFIGVIIGAMFVPAAVAAGWLIGFCFWSQLLVGSLVLLMIHRLTSGRWGEIAAPTIVPAARAIPLLLLLVIPVFLGIPTLYPWSHHIAAIKPDVLTRYLNLPFFIVRSFVALGGWAVLSIFVLRDTGLRSQCVAAFGLAFHAVAVSAVGIDWYLSQAAPFTSSSFGASVAITQLIAAMAWTIIICPIEEGDETIGDLAALLLAFILGLTYIDFMAVLVIWYGDLPQEEAWFVTRGPWLPLGLAAFILTAVIPIFSLLLSAIRSSLVALRVLGLTVLFGLACYDAYLVAPGFGVASLFWALASVIGVGCALTGWMFAEAGVVRSESLSHAV